MGKDKWLNVYDYRTAYVFGSALYRTPKEATKDLADKLHYLHTVNIVTGEIKKINLE